MSKFEIKKLFEFRKSHYLPCGLNIKDQLWWRFMPGVVINVKWPVGEVVVGPSSRNWSGMGPMYEEIFSTDPNDHYRPWMEKHVGKQGWDWDWGLAGQDVTGSRLTIKIRRKYQDCAILAKLQWA